MKTKEIDHYAIPPEGYEYVLKLVDGAWRIDDRRTRNLDGRWIHRVFNRPLATLGQAMGRVR